MQSKRVVRWHKSTKLLEASAFHSDPYSVPNNYNIHTYTENDLNHYILGL